jgi:predicted aldo/keto reductase-like oxidoreductase
MRYRRFGKTNLDFSVFSLGTMRYLVSSENAYLTIKKAISLGINHIETAQGYGESGGNIRGFVNRAIAILYYD